MSVFINEQSYHYKRRIPDAVGKLRNGEINVTGVGRRVRVHSPNDICSDDAIDWLSVGRDRWSEPRSLTDEFTSVGIELPIATWVLGLTRLDFAHRVDCHSNAYPFPLAVGY